MKFKDKFKKEKKDKLPNEWQAAFNRAVDKTHKDYRGVANPLRDLDSSRPEIARAAYVVLAMGDKHEMKMLKTHKKAKQFRKELDA